MQLNEGYFIGVDGGGTKTICVLGDSTGRIISSIEGKGSNIKSTQPELVRKQMIELLGSLLRKSAISKEYIKAIYVGTAGGDRKEDQQSWYDWMRSFFQTHPCHIHISNDAVPALVSGTYSLNGLVIIAGTGSIVYLIQQNGLFTTRVGGWGYLFGDDGSGYHIGNEALRFVTTYYDQTGKEPNDEPLSQAILQYFRIQKPFELINTIYGHENPRSAIASLAKPVIELAEKQYSPAVEIVQRASTSLGNLLASLFERKQEAKNLPIVVAGSLFENHFFFTLFEQEIRMRNFSNEICVPAYPPVVGSYMNALIGVGIDLTPALKEVCRNSWLEVLTIERVKGVT